MAEIKIISPAEIEKKSMEIISEELHKGKWDPDHEQVIKRVIHATADFDYAKNLCFSENAIPMARAAILKGACIVTDTKMAWSGINKRVLEKFGGKAFCFMDDDDIAKEARERGITRSSVCMERALLIRRPLIFAIGNAPTALIKVCELVEQGKILPELIIGTPVGFVNVVESKELLLQRKDVPYIVARGRKGGSTVAAAICNAILYSVRESENMK